MDGSTGGLHTWLKSSSLKSSLTIVSSLIETQELEENLLNRPGSWRDNNCHASITVKEEFSDLY